MLPRSAIRGQKTQNKLNGPLTISQTLNVDWLSDVSFYHNCEDESAL